MTGRCDDQYLDALFFGAEFERAELRLFGQLARHSRVVLDVGANTGVYALVASAIPGGRVVVAFEPHPANVARLRENVRLNNALVTVVAAAAGDEPGSVSFTVPDDGSLSNVSSVCGDFSRAFYDVTYKDILVPQVTVDAEVERLGLGTVDLIKIDVESYELPVLRGPQEVLARDRPVVLAEVFNPDVLEGDHPELAACLVHNSTDQVEELMRELGYHAYAIGQRGLLAVNTLRAQPCGGSNFLFSPVPAPSSYIPYGQVDVIRRLLHSASPP